MTQVLDPAEPLAVMVVGAIQRGEVEVLRDALAAHPSLATARLGEPGRGAPRTLLHVATDWPGNVPRGAETIAVLIAAGADVNARFVGCHTETPLHWAASCDDVAALDALIAAGAEVDATGAVIAGGTPLDDAVAFGQWRAARRLVEHGARTALWHEAALGMLPQVEARFAGDAATPDAAAVTSAFWSACHGGQRETAACLLGRGADRDWIGYDGLTPLDAAVRAKADAVVAWLTSLGARSAHG